MVQSFQFAFFPCDHLQSAQDEFLVDNLRVRVLMQGNFVELSCEVSDGTVTIDEAAELANRYAKLLSKHLGVLLRLHPVEDLEQWPPQAITQTGLGRQGTRRVFHAIREARNGLLVSGDMTLRRAYNYLQDARDKVDGVLFSLYKCIEAFKKRFRGWETASEELQVSKEIEFVKRLANEAKRDERHPPGPLEAVEPVADADKTYAIECATRVVRAYELWLKQQAP